MSNWPNTVAAPRILSFQEMLFKVYEAMRIDKRKGPSSLTERDFIVGAINRAYLWAWKAYEWPESIVCEQWDIKGHPTRTTTAGTPAPFLPRQYNGVRIATLYDLYKEDPYANGCRHTLPYEIGPDGYYLRGPDLPTTAWPLYRPDAPTFTADPYQSDTAYKAGDRVLFETDGHCYRAITTTTGNDPSTDGVIDTAHWAQVPVLYLLQNMVIDGATALYHRDKEKFTSEAVLASSCMDELETLLLEINRQMGQPKMAQYPHPTTPSVWR